MKLKDIFDVIIQFGIQMDPRGEKEVKEQLKKTKKEFEALSEKDKKFFDMEKLVNPYSDSRIVFDNGKDVEGVLVGIDIDVAEILLAEKLKEKGKKIDAIISHHPVGRAYARFYDVMDMQADIFSIFGVPISAAEELTEKRKKEVGEKVMPANHYRAYDAAKLLEMSMLNTHTPSDNCVATFLQKKFERAKPQTLGDILDILLEEKEYSEYAKRGVPPVILNGDKKRKVKKVFVDMTGGTEGPKDIYMRLSNAGIDTVVGMHFSEEHKKAVQTANLNCVVAGHISSDTLGMNLILDEVEKKLGKLTIYETSGFIRVKRIEHKKSK
ncbi:MAG: NGG1p interacting factor NIF3 [Candidatus Goldbacteria bacterium]|nr:NGG1p interacting factor NIF3 [Candidatus Goldiibacteriota bacterium]